MKVGQRNDIDIFGTNAVPSKVIEQPAAGNDTRLFLGPKPVSTRTFGGPGNKKQPRGKRDCP